MGDHEQHAKTLRDRAEECRRPAEPASDDLGRNSYLRLAEAYDMLALQEEALAK